MLLLAALLPKSFLFLFFSNRRKTRKVQSDLGRLRKIEKYLRSPSIMHIIVKMVWAFLEEEKYSRFELGSNLKHF